MADEMCAAAAVRVCYGGVYDLNDLDEGLRHVEG